MVLRCKSANLQEFITYKTFRFAFCKTLSEEFKEAIARELDVQMPTFELFTLEAQVSSGQD